MARYSFRLPDIGEGIAEAEIVVWHVKVGDRVEEDQQVVDMMTDKATVEMESPVSGTVVELAGAVGEQVPIGSTLMVIETGVEAEPQASDTPIAAWGGQGPEAEGEGEERAASASIGADQRVAEPIRVVSVSGATVLASAAVRARARALGIDLSQVKAAGGRVRHADLDAFLRYGTAQGYAPPHASQARDDVVIKVIGLRRRIAENMQAAKRHIPHFTYIDEIDVTALEQMRADLNDNRGDRPRLTILPFLIVAICRTLPDFPMLNARFDDDAGTVTRHGRVHLGMAAQTDAGLTVPVIRDAQDKNIWQLAAEIARLAEAARMQKLKPDELGGGTITVTSLGPLGGIATTPVINRPEVAIIGPNKIVERPVFRGDEIIRAKVMNLSMSCDHRVVDGWDAASYVQALRTYLETPALLFVPG